jgi:hypothetical protein
MTNPTFGDRVRIRGTDETRSLGHAGPVGDADGETVPSISGADPVIGDRGDDYAL